MYPGEVRQLAALVASKVYYHLGSYEDSLSYALGAGPLFDVTQGSQYVETIIAKCIDSYTARRAEEGATMDTRLEDIVNRMFDRWDNGCWLLGHVCNFVSVLLGVLSTDSTVRLLVLQ